MLTVWTAIFFDRVCVYLKMIKLFLWFSNRYMYSVISVICIWTPPCGPSRYQVHFASRITYIIDCIRTSALILRWRWSVYLLGSALTFFWPLVVWTIITLFYCTVSFRFEYIYILSELVLLYLKWFRIRSVLWNYSFDCLFPSCCVL